jgi:hypothetical protein
LVSFKEQAIARRDAIDPSIILSQGYSSKLLERVCASEFEVDRAQPIEEARCNVTDGDIRENFANLEGIEISGISPHLVLNLDETRFSASKSGRTKFRKVIVSTTLYELSSSR